jgi:hypothetical protein
MWSCSRNPWSFSAQDGISWILLKSIREIISPEIIDYLTSLQLRKSIFGRTVLSEQKGLD